ncbi:glycosyltransferase family 4 protein [candidate division KSB1 bacterium]|nr:glycosyltransferase family 4 protein [candidate division KSB1 bacterium]
MKILYFNYLYDLYGVSIGSTIKAERLMAALSEFGFDVQIFWLKKQPQTGTENNKKKALNETLKQYLARYLHDLKALLLNIRYIYEEYKIVKKQKPDLIIARLDLYLFSALLISKLKKIPLIIEADAPCVYEAREFHPQYWGIPNLAEFIEKLNLYQADLSICVSNEAKKYFLKYGVPDQKLNVVTNGADINLFNNEFQNEKIISTYGLKNKIVIGFIGSFHLWHGVENLIHLIKQVVCINQRVVFLLVGQGGPMQSSIESFIETNNLSDKVIKTGYISHDEIPEYISAMDVVLAPYPGLKFFYYSPVKIFEYMACGKPVVSTKIGQIAELIEDGYNGMICSPDNLDEMYNKIKRLVNEPGLRNRIGENARNSILQNHSWREKGRQLSKMCNEVINSYKGKA